MLVPRQCATSMVFVAAIWNFNRRSTLCTGEEHSIEPVVFDKMDIGFEILLKSAR
jgi:hypothetical protein